MPATDLTTLTSVKMWLGLTGQSDDALLTSLVSRASDLCKTYLKRDIISATYTETINGTGTARVQVKHFPITAVTSVSVYGVAIPASVNGSYGYAWDEYGIYLVGNPTWNNQGQTFDGLQGGCFPPNPQSVVVVYTGGYATVPTDLAQSVDELVGYLWTRRKRIGEFSKSVGGEVISFDHSAIPPEIEIVWKKYKRVSGW